MGNSGSCQKSKLKSSSCKLQAALLARGGEGEGVGGAAVHASMVVSALASVSAYYVVFGDAR